MSETPERTALYRIRGDEDLLLYIGVSNDFGRRWKQHAKQQPWWPEMRRLAVDEWFDSREEAEAAEIVAIKTEGPKYNFTHSVPPRPRRRKSEPQPQETRHLAPLMLAPDWRKWRCPDSPDGMWTIDAWHEHAIATAMRKTIEVGAA